MRRALLIALAALGAASSVAPAEASVKRGLAFGRASGRTLKLDLYRSEKVPARNAPVIVWIHGGGFYEGTRAEIGPYAEAFARRGYLSLSIDYRLHTESFVMHGGYTRAIADAQHDAQAAVRWVRRHAASLGADTHRIHA